MRLFLGAPVPTGPVYLDFLERLRGLDVGARPVPEGTWHVTLRFLGEMEDPVPVVDALEPVLAGRKAIPARVQGVGAFKDARHARIVWAHVDAPGLKELADAVVAATADLGEEPPKRDFRAHVTLARIKKPVDLRGLLDQHRDLHFADGDLDRIVLWRSGLTPQGPLYTPVHIWHLEPGDDRAGEDRADSEE